MHGSAAVEASSHTGALKHCFRSLDRAPIALDAAFVAAVGLLYVGAVLFVNGLALVGLVEGTSMIPMNLFVGLLQVITPLYLIFSAHGDQATIVGASACSCSGSRTCTWR